MSSFQAIPIKVAGQTYEHRSSGISVQKTMNLIPQRELTGAGMETLTAWPGCVGFATASGINRGMAVFDDELYKVNNTTLFKVDSTGTYTSLGTIAGSGRCVFANDGTNLIITTGGEGYQLTGSTLTQITDPDFQNGNSVTYLNQQMIFDGNGGKFQVADVGDPDSIQSNNFATAESAPDDTVRVYAFKERLYLFGEKTVEVWYNSGTGNPPFAKIAQGTMEVGLGAVHSVQNSDQFMYWLGDDRRVYRLSAMQEQNVSSIAVSHQIDVLSATNDAIGSIIRIEGQTFYKLDFPTGNKTIVFNEDAGAWFDLSTGADEQRYIGEDVVECYGKRLIADKNSGNVLELSLTTYADNGTTRIYERVFGPVTSQQLGIDGRAVMSYLDLDMETGVGVASGQGSNPQALVSASFDNGKTWTIEGDVLLGRTGEGRLRVRWDHISEFYDAYFRIRCSDPVFFSLFGALLGVKKGGY